MGAHRRAFLLSAVLLLAFEPAKAETVSAEVVNNWGTGAERAALQVIQDAYAARGGKLTSTVVQNGTQVLATTVDRIIANDPPTSATFSPSSLYLDLFEKGALNDIEEVATAGKWRDVLPPFIVDAISYKGRIYIAPVSMTVANWLYSNAKVLQKAGIERMPATYDDEFFTALDKIKAAGFIPLGMGGDTTVYRWVFESTMQVVGGRDLWLAVWDKKDEAAVRGPQMRKVFETFKRFHNYIDDGAPGRSWAAAAHLVVSGQAGMTIVGDWGKAEFINAGMVPGKDFYCNLQGKAPFYVVRGDMFGFPKSDKSDVIAAQKLLAQTLFDPKVQSDYNIIKSGMPARTDVDVKNDSKFDECSQKAAAIYNSGNGVVGNIQWYLSPDGAGSFSDLLADYFNYPEMTTDQMVDRFWAILKNDQVRRTK
jgi:glucose/mannose transport system substrate-binding protein